ncbi:MAG: biopolymer transporter ExbD [Burkholderiales bacterium]|nr:MAG: biopolymer transporter ExbD [Burkholderiales bacterium]
MAIGTRDDSDEMLSEINMIPFIDVMLVLLIIFIITVPVIKHAVSVDLPKASSQRLLDKPQNIRVVVDADGLYHWNGARVEDGQLAERLAAAAAQDPQPELHIRGDRAVRYERVAELLAAAQRAGLSKIGFVTEPATP